MDMDWDCVVIGGGAAGLSAALVLGRARRRVLVLDAGAQSNLAAHGIGGLLGHDGRPPAELYEMGRKELQRYSTVKLRDKAVADARRVEGGFDVGLADGSRVGARRLLLAMGMEYRPPGVPGLSELWGSSVFHCPFCHGWEVRDRPLAVLANGERAAHLALLLSGWSDDIVVLTNGPADLTADDVYRLTAAGIAIDERVVTELVADDGELAAVGFGDGTRLPRAGLLTGISLHQRTDLAARLGVRFVPPNPVSSEIIEVDPMARTSVPGVFAAGDVCTPMPQVASAVAAGSMAAASIVTSLLEER
ncbi:NAD(P)/FAD-dependent oxidoreductase [Mycolicibacterium sp.]|uniref:NAD(P)/FAD-dependent oxidoreductase n=2 Tax=Mycolicibacterium sp. TaxID=2320850 RepID=UPI003D112D2C